jgi:hypothetical protein
MSVLTKQDLEDWNSHPVTKQIFIEINTSIDDLSKESNLRDTVDQTAMQTAYNEGVKEGVYKLRDAYEDLSEATE